MAGSNSGNSSVVSVVGVVAILILVGLAVYFVINRTGDDADFEIDLDSSSMDAPAVVAEAPSGTPPWSAEGALAFLG